MFARCAARIRASLHAAVTWWRDPYRPELHYMRGPGPRWHARHAADLP